MRLRDARPDDSILIQAIYHQAFTPAEVSLVADVAVSLLAEPLATSLVAEISGSLLGHVAFSPVRAQNGQAIGQILAPLAVHPDHQRKGIGYSLVNEGLTSIDHGWVFVYGDPEYYSRFGFTHEAAGPFTPPYPLRFPLGWLALNRGGSSGSQAGPIMVVSALDQPSIW
jgi:putative acetyltransferase